MKTRGDAWGRMETHGDAWRRKILRLYKSTPSTTTALSGVEAVLAPAQ
ncbi:MAG: hypothetical protein LBF59_03885 [Prevotellaceae bacterium]|nr:hypothetical protein [Prevotellaceae bacterium]